MVILTYDAINSCMQMTNTQTNVYAYLCNNTWFVVRPEAVAAIMCTTIESAFKEVSKS